MPRKEDEYRTEATFFLVQMQGDCTLGRCWAAVKARKRGNILGKGVRDFKSSWGMKLKDKLILVLKMGNSFVLFCNRNFSWAFEDPLFMEPVNLYMVFWYSYKPEVFIVTLTSVIAPVVFQFSPASIGSHTVLVHHLSGASIFQVALSSKEIPNTVMITSQ